MMYTHAHWSSNVVSAVLLCCILVLVVPARSQDTCTLCFQNATYDITAVTESGTLCATLDAIALQVPPLPDSDCTGIQLTGFSQCACPEPPSIGAGTCHICGNDTLSFNGDKPTNVFGDDLFALFGSNITCSELNALANIVSSDDGCADWTSFGPYCECEGQEIACPLCPDGSSVPDPNLELTDGLTCEFLQTSAALLQPAQTDECSEIRVTSFACGCPNVTPQCTLCPLGESIADPDKFVTDAEATCGELETTTQSFVTADECNGSQFLGVLFCGCSPDPMASPGICGPSICPDGTTPVPLPDAVLDDDVTCTDLQNAVGLVDTTDICEALYRAGVEVCGCVGDPPMCPLCEDGSYPPDALFFVTEDRNCAQFAAALPMDVEESCPAFQGVYGSYCGCANPIASADACAFCPDGGLPETTRRVQFFGRNRECVSYEFLATKGDAEYTCDEATMALNSYCCEETVACSSVCPDGNPVPNPSKIAYENPDGSLLSCGDLSAFLASVPPYDDVSTCQFFHFLGVSQCGCKGAAPTCPLCEDGSPLEDPFLDFDSDRFCLTVQSQYNNTPAESSVCRGAQASAGVYCKCDNPIASQGSCRICGDDTLLPDAMLIVELSPGLATSCGALELSANVGELECSDAQSIVGPLCCEGAVLPPPTTLQPTMTPPTPTSGSDVVGGAWYDLIGMIFQLHTIMGITASLVGAW